MPNPLPKKVRAYDEAANTSHKRPSFYERFPSSKTFILSERDDVQTLRLLLARHCNLKDCPEQVIALCFFESFLFLRSKGWNICLWA
jgi:hypothetical protein